MINEEKDDDFSLTTWSAAPTLLEENQYVRRPVFEDGSMEGNTSCKHIVPLGDIKGFEVEQFHNLGESCVVS